MSPYQISKRAEYYAEQRQARAALERLARLERAARRRGGKSGVRQVRNDLRHVQ